MFIHWWMILIKSTLLFMIPGAKYALSRVKSIDLFFLVPYTRNSEKLADMQNKWGEWDQWGRSRESGWDTCNFGVSALKKYLGLTLLMGLVKKKDTAILEHEIFLPFYTLFWHCYVMSRNNFQLISKYLHCFDNTWPEEKKDNALYDPLLFSSLPPSGG